MRKNIHLFILSYFLFSITTIFAQTDAEKVGYYQTIDLNTETPCGCDQKTERTYQLSKGIENSDLKEYKLYAYRYDKGTNTQAFLKLFKAFENDPNIVKLSMKKWDAFMLLTSEKFDAASFEQAAANVFVTFNKITPEEFLKEKNTGLYEYYIQQQSTVK